MGVHRANAERVVASVEEALALVAPLPVGLAIAGGRDDIVPAAGVLVRAARCRANTLRNVAAEKKTLALIAPCPVTLRHFNLL
jgi:hypothetical protein